MECVGHSFAYVAHFIFLSEVWIRTQRAAVASSVADLDPGSVALLTPGSGMGK
jgi:hypothetical protein